MADLNCEFVGFAESYLKRLSDCFSTDQLSKIQKLSEDLLSAWKDRSRVFICGNGGSAANAIHMANDFHYGIGACSVDEKLPGIKVDALPANQGIMTCLANDTGYDNVFSHQLEVNASPGDLLIVLSGSGNSKNVINALGKAKDIKMKTYAIVAFDGGDCKFLADTSIHFPIDDMQIAEDTQLIIGHICMQWLNANKPTSLLG